MVLENAKQTAEAFAGKGLNCATRQLYSLSVKKTQMGSNSPPPSSTIQGLYTGPYLPPPHSYNGEGGSLQGNH